jgi:hypothetical protein
MWSLEVTFAPLCRCLAFLKAHPEFFTGEGGEHAGPEAIYNLCLILKIML